MPNPPLTTEERVIELTLRIIQQENLIIALSTSVVETATAVANLAACVRGTTDRQAVKEAAALVSVVLKRVQPLIESNKCSCGKYQPVLPNGFMVACECTAKADD